GPIRSDLCALAALAFVGDPYVSVTPHHTQTFMPEVEGNCHVDVQPLAVLVRLDHVGVGKVFAAFGYDLRHEPFDLTTKLHEVALAAVPEGQRPHEAQAVRLAESPQLPVSALGGLSLAAFRIARRVTRALPWSLNLSLAAHH